MSELSSKIAYLKGYAEGLGAEFKSDEGKIIEKLIDIIEAMAQEIADLEMIVEENCDLIDEIDDTVLAIAEDFYGDDDDDDDEYSDFDDDDLFGDFDDDFDDFTDEDDEDDDEFSSDFFEIQCPECNEDFMINYDEITDEGEINCPHCKKRVELEIDFEDGGDDEWSF